MDSLGTDKKVYEAKCFSQEFEKLKFEDKKKIASFIENLKLKNQEEEKNESNSNS